MDLQIKQKYNKSNNTYRHIVVSAKNYEKLKKIGNMTDSFNDVVTKLLTKNDDATFWGEVASSSD